MSYQDWLAHHGIKGMKWGKLNGPPYPLSDAQRSATENRLNTTSASARALAKEGPNNRFVKPHFAKADDLASGSKKTSTSGGGGGSSTTSKKTEDKKEETKTTTSSSSSGGHTADYFKRNVVEEFNKNGKDEEWEKAKATKELEESEEDKKKAAEKAAKEAEKARKAQEKAAEKARKEKEKAEEKARKQKEAEEKARLKAEEEAKKAEEKLKEAEEKERQQWEKDGQKAVDDVFNDDINQRSFKDLLDSFYKGAFDRKIVENEDDAGSENEESEDVSEDLDFYAKLLSKVDPKSSEYAKIKDTYDELRKEAADEKIARESKVKTDNSEESEESETPTATALARLSRSISALADYADYVESNSRTEVNRIHSKILGYLDDKLKWFSQTASTNASGEAKLKQLQSYGEIEDWLKEHGF